MAEPQEDKILSLLKQYLFIEKNIKWKNNIDYECTTLCLNRDHAFFYRVYTLGILEEVKKREQYANARVLEELEILPCLCYISKSGLKNSYGESFDYICKRCKRIKELKEVKQP
jgi:hypothetical protein